MSANQLSSRVASSSSSSSSSSCCEGDGGEELRRLRRFQQSISALLESGNSGWLSPSSQSSASSPLVSGAVSVPDNSSTWPAHPPPPPSSSGFGNNNNNNHSGSCKSVAEANIPPLSDVVVAAEGREIRAHRVVLAAASNYFFKLFTSASRDPPPNRIEFQQQWTVVQQLVLCMYGADLSAASTRLSPSELLAILEEVHNLELTSISPKQCIDKIATSLTPSNLCSLLQQHEELCLYPDLSYLVSDFVAAKIQDVLATESAVRSLVSLPLNSSLMIDILRQACASAADWSAAKTVIKLALDWRRFSSICDLLRDCRTWDWLPLKAKFTVVPSLTDALSGQASSSYPHQQQHLLLLPSTDHSTSQMPQQTTLQTHQQRHLSVFANTDTTTKASPAEDKEQMSLLPPIGGVVTPTSRTFEMSLPFVSANAQLHEHRLSTEWRIPNLKSALLLASSCASSSSSNLSRVVVGESFHWLVRLDAEGVTGSSSEAATGGPTSPDCEGSLGGDRKLRLVYEAVFAKPRQNNNKNNNNKNNNNKNNNNNDNNNNHNNNDNNNNYYYSPNHNDKAYNNNNNKQQEEAEESSHCIQRFPAAQFTWSCVFRGSNVCHERPVFICFPDKVSLHWSTTIPLNIHDLTDNDSLDITVSMVEAPLVSLILYHFSRDLQSTIGTEDIWNRLPHIEYRCLSSYTLLHSTYSAAKNH